jgi:hypothetical protein
MSSLGRALISFIRNIYNILTLTSSYKRRIPMPLLHSLYDLKASTSLRVSYYTPKTHLR